MTDTERLDWMEKMADEGLCPAIVNDDNGHWAMVFDGTQNVPEGDGPQDIATSFWVKADQWKPTFREAMDAGIAEFRQESSGNSE
jgi:hypothetical protein